MTGALTINTAQLSLGAGSIITDGATTGSAITINSLTTPLTILGPDSFSTTISSSGGTINVSAASGQSLTLGKSAGSGTTTINMNGGAVTTTSTAGSTTVSASVLLVSNNNITINVNGDTFTNNCTIRSNTATSGAGSISLQSTGALTVASVGILTVDPTAAGGGNGGTIKFIAPGALTMPGVSLSANGIGSGNFTGGQITIQAGSLSITGGGQLALSTNATGSSAGGTVSFTTTGGGGDINVGNGIGSVSISAKGGSASSSSGNGARVTVSAGGSLTVDPAALAAGPSGVNGNGPTLTLAAGTSGSGNLQVHGTVSADGKGTGSGGSINITYTDATNPFVTGTIVTSSGVSGDITANAPGTGNGGSITITNGAAAPLTVNVQGSISAATANTSALAIGSINFNRAGQAVNVTLGGTLIATVNSSGASVSFNVLPASGTLNLGTISSTAGSINLTSQNPGYRINVISAPCCGQIAAAGGGVFISTYALTNGGTISSSQPSGSISIQSPGALTIDGTGSMTLTGGGSGSITLAAAGANNLQFNGSQLFNPGSSSGRVVLNAQSTGGSISIGNTWQLTVANSGALTISTPSLALSASAKIIATGASVINLDSGSGPNPLTITAPDGTSATISTAGGSISIVPTPGQSLTFAKSSGPFTTTLTLSGGTVTTTTIGSPTIVNAGVKLAGDNNITMNVGSGTFLNDGTITTSKAGGAITIQSSGGLTLDSDTSGTVSVTGGGSASILVATTGATVLRLNSSFLFDAGQSGTVTFKSSDPGASISVAQGVTVSVAASSQANPGGPGGMLLINTPLISIDTGAAATFAMGGQTVVPMVVQTMTISPTSGLPLHFQAASASGFATLNLNGGPVTLTTAGSTTTIDSNVTLSTDTNLTINANHGVLANFGTITSSGVSNSLTVQSADVLSLSGTGIFNQRNQGTTRFLAASTTGSINVTAGTSYVIGGGGQLIIGTPSLIFGAESSIAASGPSAVSITSGGAASGLAIILPDGSSATVSTTGGSIALGPTAGQSLSVSTLSGIGSSILNLSGGPVTTVTSSSPTIVSAGVTISINNYLTLNVNDSTLTNAGTIRSFTESGQAGSIAIQSSGSLSVVNAGLMNVNPSAAAGGSGGSIKISGAGPLTITSTPLAANGVGAGDFGGGQIAITSSTLAVPTSILTLQADAVGNGSGGTISVTTTGAGGNFSVGTSTGKLIVSASGGSLSSTSGNGGTVFLSAGGSLIVDPAALTAAPLGSNGDGANITLIAGTAGASQLQVQGDLKADGAGSGNGGSITILYNDPVNPFVVGAGQVTNSDVNGNISASAPGSGSPGVVNLTTSSTLAGAPVSIQLAGNIAAQINSGVLDSLNFNNTVGSVTVNGNGFLLGVVNSSASNVAITLGGAGAQLTVGSVTASGNVDLEVTSASSLMFLPTPSSAVNAGGNMTIVTPHLTNNGSLSTTVNGNSAILIQSPAGAGPLELDGTPLPIVMSGMGSKSITVEGAGGSALNFDSSYTFVAGSSGIVTLQGGSVNLGNGTTQDITGNSQLVVVTASLSFGTSSNILSKSGATSIAITDAGVYPSLSVVVTDGSSGQISTTGNITISGSPGVPVQFKASPGVIGSALNLFGAQTTFSASTAPVTIDSGVTINLDPSFGTATTRGGFFTIMGSAIYLNGSITAGSTGSVLFLPDSNVPILLGGTAKIAGFNLTSAELNRVSSNSLIVGSTSISGGIQIVGDIDVSSPATNLVNVLLKNSDNYQAAGTSISLGNKALTITSLGQIATGTMAGSDSASITLTGNSLNLAEPISIGTVFLKPASDLPVVINTTNHTSGLFDITGAELGRITAHDLVVGEAAKHAPDPGLGKCAK